LAFGAPEFSGDCESAATACCFFILAQYNLAVELVVRLTHYSYLS
jgi:hypothetical protein